MTQITENNETRELLELDDIRRRAGVMQESGTNPVESIANAHVVADADGETIMNSIVAASGGDPKKVVLLTLGVVDRLISYPGSIHKLVKKLGG